MTTLSLALSKVKEFLADNATSTSSSKQLDQSTLHRNLFQHLCDIAQAVEVAVDPILLKDDHIAMLEDLCVGKKVHLTKAYQSILLTIYQQIIKQGPGYIIRNLVTSMITLFNNKLLTVAGRECAIDVLAMIMKSRINDCASQVTDVYLQMGKLMKMTDISIRVGALKCLSQIVVAENGRMSDLYVEIAKIASRSVADKVPEVRKYSAELFEAIIRFSDGFSIIGIDAIQPYLLKGVEDDNAETQDAFVHAMAALYETQIRSYEEKQEQTKIGVARGSDNIAVTPVKAKSSSRLSFSKLTMKKAVVEEVTDYHTVIDNIIKLIYKHTGALRVGYMFVLGYVIGGYLDKTSAEELLWMVSTFMAIPQDNPSIASLSYEEQNIFRIRLSHIFRTQVIAKVNENQLLAMVGELLKQAGGMEATSKSELELQHILYECNHICTVLGHTVVAVQDEVMMTATIQLQHASFGVRSAAASLLLTLSVLSPGVVATIVHTSILHTKNKTKELLEMDGMDLSAMMGGGVDDDGEVGVQSGPAAGGPGSSSSSSSSNAGIGGAAGTPANGGNQPATVTNPVQKKKSPQELEKLSKMFYFHGHTLVLSMIMKHTTALPNGGLPLSTVLEVFDLGVFLLTQDITTVIPSLRHVVCSIIRAGGLLLSSCLSMGYSVAKHRIGVLLPQVIRVTRLFEHATIQKVEDALYEMMCMESAIICITSLLRYTSEALALEANCLQQVIEQLEWCFKTIKVRYQPSLKHHFRFKTLHMILLETFIYLPSGSYPNSLPQIYIEALRVFRDCVSLGYECSANLMQSCTQSDGLFPNHQPQSMRVFTSNETVMHQMLVMYKLEHFIMALEKKEHEAFLSMLGKERPSVAVLRNGLDQLQLQVQVNGRVGEDLNMESLAAQDVLGGMQVDGSNGAGAVSAMQAVSSSLIDTRMLDTSMRLIATTFVHQSSEYQDKATQLFHQALTQLTAVAAGANPTAATTVTASVTARLSFTTSASSISAVSTLTASSSAATASAANKGMSLFTSSSQEEERKRREKRVFSIYKNVICVYQLLVHAFPMHAGRYIEQDYPWRQSMIDHVYDMLSHPDFNIKHTAAMTMFALATKWKQSTLVSTVCTKVRMTFITSLEKKTDTQGMNVYVGYVMVLAYLWLHCLDDLDMRSLIQTTIFDCLRKLDQSSVMFQSYVLMACRLLCQGHLDELPHQSTPDMMSRKTAEVEDLVDKLCYHSQAMLANTVHIGGEDFVWLLHGMLLSLGHAIAASVAYNLPEVLIARLQTLWKSLTQITQHLMTPSSKHILQPALSQAYLFIQRHDSQDLFVAEIWRYLEAQLVHADYTDLVDSVTATSGSVLWTHCQLLQGVLQRQVVSPIVGYTYLGHLLDAVYVKLSSTAFLAQPEVEFSCDYLAVESDYNHCARCLRVVFSTWRQLQYNHVVTEGDGCVAWYLLLYRSLALGLHLHIVAGDAAANASAATVETSTASAVSTSGGRDEDDDEDFFDTTGGNNNGNASAKTSTSAKTPGSSNNAAIPGADHAAEPVLAMTSETQFITFFRDHCLHQVPLCKSGSRLAMKSMAVFLASECLEVYFTHQYASINPSAHLALHTNLHQAREYILDLCDGTKPPKSRSYWISLPCVPLVLFVTDLVNFPCYSVGFTVQDKHVLGLQVTAVRLLYRVLDVYKDSLDLDVGSIAAASATPNADFSADKVLTQSLSTLLAAVRTALTVAGGCPALQNVTYNCLALLVEYGYIRDKLAFSRLLKPLLAYGEEAALLPSDGVYSDSKTLSTEQGVLARCYYCRLMAYFSEVLQPANTVYGKHTASTVRSVLTSSIPSILPPLEIFAHDLLCDLLRVLHHRNASNSSTASVQPAYSSEEIHPRRGGFTYSTAAQYASLVGPFLSCFATLAALYLHRSATDDSHSRLVAVVVYSVLQDFAGDSMGVPQSGSPRLTVDSWVELLSVVLSLAQLPVQDDGVLGSQYWQGLLTNLATLGSLNVLPHRVEVQRSLLRIMLQVVSKKDGEGVEDATRKTELWKVFVQLTRSLLPQLLLNDTSSQLCAAQHWVDVLGKKKMSASTGKEQGAVIILLLQILEKLQTASASEDESAAVEMTKFVLQWASRLSVAALHYSTEQLASVQVVLTSIVQHALTNNNNNPIVTAMVHSQCHEMFQMMFTLTQEYLQQSNTNVELQTKIAALYDISVMTWLQLYHRCALLPQMAETSQQQLMAWLLQVQSTQSATYRSMLQLLAQRVLTTVPNIAIQATHQWLLPLVLAGLLPNAQKAVDWEERVLYIRLYLQFFNYLQQHQVTILEAFVQISLPILCQSIQAYQREDAHVQLCGKALTLMARQASDVFRGQIASLTDESKQWLQFAMKAALQQDQQPQQGGGAAANAPVAKTINMDKYRK